MSTPMFAFPTVVDTANVDIPGIVNGAVQGIEDNLPYRFVATMAELEATGGPLHPNGQMAVLTADNAGVRGGSHFIRKGNQWLFAGGHVADLTTFLGLLSANIGTLPGAVVYDAATTSSRIFSATNGTNSIIQEVGSSTWINITHAAGYQNGTDSAPFGYRATPGGVTLRGAIQKTGGSPISGVQGTVIGNLPGGARPSYVVQSLVSGVNESVGTVMFKPDGRILVTAIANRTTNWLYFDGIFLPQGA